MEPKPFGWWDSFNNVMHTRWADAKAAMDGGNVVTPLYAGHGRSQPEQRDLMVAVGELSMACGNPCVEFSGDETAEAAVVRYAATRVKERRSLYDRCERWVENALGTRILTDLQERVMRVLEEAMELAQSEGVGRAAAQRLIDRVWSRTVGDPVQESAGVEFTLRVYSRRKGFDLDMALERELERVEDPALIEKIRKKHADKVLQGVGIDPSREIQSPYTHFAPGGGRFEP